MPFTFQEADRISVGNGAYCTGRIDIVTTTKPGEQDSNTQVRVNIFSSTD